MTSKLTWEDVRKIRRDFRGLKQIADTYKVAISTIQAIKTGKTWVEPNMVSRETLEDTIWNEALTLIIKKLQGMKK